MDTLTKKYFDEKMDEVKNEIKDEIKNEIKDEINGLATMVAKGFDDIAKRLDVRERVEKLENKMTKVESALNVHL